VSRALNEASVSGNEASASLDKDKPYARDPRSGTSMVRTMNVLEMGETTEVLRRLWRREKKDLSK